MKKHPNPKVSIGIIGAFVCAFGLAAPPPGAFADTGQTAANALASPPITIIQAAEYKATIDSGQGAVNYAIPPTSTFVINLAREEDTSQNTAAVIATTIGASPQAKALQGNAPNDNQLVKNNGFGANAPNTVTITANNTAGTLLDIAANANINGQIGNTVLIDTSPPLTATAGNSNDTEITRAINTSPPASAAAVNYGVERSRKVANANVGVYRANGLHGEGGLHGVGLAANFGCAGPNCLAVASVAPPNAISLA